ncbi:SDR family NAD(P)-dependent oxidoreductase [Persicobacter diffluens]|uniref:Short-chain dehydrogenase n=1 Tax=Persicobacter diffluens TaxID=981 RepID=A0AAN5ALX1_9BACT|nr:short-chain dehydrogenase [Persicobacter diffluens]
MTNRHFMASKTVWIIGASSGVGKALLYEFLNRDYRIIVSSSDAQKLQAAVREVVYVEKDLLVKPLNLEQPDTFPDIVDEVFRWAEGSIESVIFSAGIGQRSSFVDLEYWVFERVMQVNFMSYTYLTKLILPYFEAAQAGRFVVLSSVQGKFGIPNRTAYAASKHALHGFFDSLRAENFPWLKVLLVCPAYINTEFAFHAMLSNGNEQAKQDKGQAHGISPEECAEDILKAIDKNKREIVMGKWQQRIGVWIKRFFPALLERIVRARVKKKVDQSIANPSDF